MTFYIYCGKIKKKFSDCHKLLAKREIIIKQVFIYNKQTTINKNNYDDNNIFVINVFNIYRNRI